MWGQTVLHVQAELLEALEVEHKKQESKKAAKKKKKAAVKAVGAPSDDHCVDAPPSKDSSLDQPSGCSKCALLQDAHKLCFSCSGKAGATAAKPSHSASSSRSGPSAIKVLHGHDLHSALSQSPRRDLARLCTGISSGTSSSSNSTPHSPSSSGATDTGTPDSQASQQTDDGWEIQQRSKRIPVQSDRYSIDSSGSSLGAHSRSCRSAVHPSHVTAWQGPNASSMRMKDASAHHGPAAGTEVLHLPGGPVAYQPPPPPPPPRARAATPAVAAPSKPTVVKPLPGSVGNAWGSAPKYTAVTTAHVNAKAWVSAVHQVGCRSLYIWVQLRLS